VDKFYEVARINDKANMAYKDAWNLKRLWGFTADDVRQLFALIQRLREQHGFADKF
ncbi:unnamed protein product, partial [Durusdinium trenchii]